MHSIVTVTGSGQITLPAEYRRKHGIEKGDKIVVTENANGDLVVSNPVDVVRKLAGIVKAPPGMKPEGDFEDLIDEAFEEGYAEEYARKGWSD
jgi:AbrB family looped-hinge helix DNA binding protein